MPIVIPESEVESALAGFPESAAADVRGALEWTAGFTEVDAELELSRHGLQRFLWYALPRKWLVSPADQIAVADSLAAFLDGLKDGGRAHEYAELCRSEATRELIELYEHDEEAGVARFLELEAEAGIEPPDTPALSWGVVMGAEEANLRDQAASVLEAAIELGDVEPGERGWRRAQCQILERFLNMPRDDLDGRTPLEQIHNERIESWRSSFREQHSAMAHRIWPLISGASEALRPNRAADVAGPLRWLLASARDGDGLLLTKAGFLNRAIVREAAERYPSWWEADLFGPPHREIDLRPLEELHDLCRRTKLLRALRGKLVLAPAGRACLDDLAKLAEVAARELIGTEFSAAVAEPVLASLLLRGEADPAGLTADAYPIVVEQGWSQDGGPIAAAGLTGEVHRVIRRGEGLGAIEYETLGAASLTPAGRRLAARALWLTATGPRGWV